MICCYVYFRLMECGAVLFIVYKVDVFMLQELHELLIIHITKHLDSCNHGRVVFLVTYVVFRVVDNFPLR